MLNRVPYATKTADRPPLTSERLTNLFVEKAPADAKAQTVLFNTPGQVAFCELADIRGFHEMSGVLYAVAGEKLYSVDSAGTSTELGDIPGSDRVYMADNGTQLCIVANPTGYIYATSLAEITDPDWPGASTVTYMDGYFIFSRADSGQFFISALLDGTDIDALDFATAERSPDNVIRVIADHGELWLFGTKTIEVWYNSGRADFPFERINAAAIERGCKSAATVTKMDNSLVWLGDDNIVYRANGYVPQRISDHGLEEDIESLTGAVGWSYTQEGHKFYVLTYSSLTAVYDAATGLWHNRQTYGQGDWAPKHYCYCYDKHLVSGEKIYYLDRSVYADDGGDIIAEIVSVPYGDNTISLVMRRFQLDIEAGVGLGTGEDPKATLSFSDDGGKTWSNEIEGSLGRVGNYSNRIVWRRLGRFRQRILRVRISDPVKRAVMGGFVDYG